jgi:hypothetical protein
MGVRMGIEFLSQWQSGQGVVIQHKLMLRKEWSYTSIPPLGLHGLFWGELYSYLYLFSLYTDEYVESAEHYVSISKPSRVILLWKESGVHCEIMWNMRTAWEIGRAVMKLNRPQGGAGFKHREDTIMEKRRRQRENINDVFALLCCYTTFIGGCLLTFRISLCVPWYLDRYAVPKHQ